MNYATLFEEARTLALVALRDAAVVPASLMHFESDFPIYAGNDFIALNCHDLQRAPEFSKCTGIVIGHHVFFPDSNEEVTNRLRTLDAIGP